jgi:penicillin-binding protein 1A
MGKAYKDRPRTEYKKPADAVFLTVHGHLEAFKPGTEPKYNSADSAQRSQAGPRPYTETWKEVPKEPSVNEVPPPDKKTLQDAAELY